MYLFIKQKNKKMRNTIEPKHIILYTMISEKKKTKKQNKNQIRVSLEWDPCKKKMTVVKGR